MPRTIPIQENMIFEHETLTQFPIKYCPRHHKKVLDKCEAANCAIAKEQVTKDPATKNRNCDECFLFARKVKNG